MRKLVYGINLSIDGCCDHTKFGGGKEVHDYFTALMEESDLLVYGRITYELMSPFWPDLARSTDPDLSPDLRNFAATYAAMDKLVFSRTLQSVEESNARIVSAEIEKEIDRLKQMSGKNMLLGGVDLPAHLMEAGLVDELHIVIHPVMVGAGRRLFDGVDLVDKLPVLLHHIRTFADGCVALVYRKM